MKFGKMTDCDIEVSQLKIMHDRDHDHEVYNCNIFLQGLRSLGAIVSYFFSTEKLSWLGINAGREQY